MLLLCSNLYFGFLQPYGYPGERRSREYPWRRVGHHAAGANCPWPSYKRRFPIVRDRLDAVS